MAYAQDCWQNSRRIEIGGLPNIETEFNILIPVQNSPGKRPASVVLAFTSNTLNSLGVSGRQKVLRVYRIFGPAVMQPAYSPLIAVNGLTASGDASLVEDFSTDW